MTSDQGYNQGCTKFQNQFTIFKVFFCNTVALAHESMIRFYQRFGSEPINEPTLFFEMAKKMSLIEKINAELETENGAEFYAELLKVVRAGREKFAAVLTAAREEKRAAREAALAEKRAKQIARAQRILDGLPNEPREGTKAWQAWQAFDHYGSLNEALPVLLENGHIESTTRVQYSRWKKARNDA